MVKIKIKRRKIKLGKIKIKRRKIRIKSPIKADIVGDLKSPGKILKNTGKVATKTKSDIDRELTGIKRNVDRELTNAKREVDAALTKAKRYVDKESEELWRNIYTEFSYFFETACGKSSRMKSLGRKLRQGEISSEKYEEEKARIAEGDPNCNFGGGWDSEDGLYISNGTERTNPLPSPKGKVSAELLWSFIHDELADAATKWAPASQFIAAINNFRNKPIWPGEARNFEIFLPSPDATIRGKDGYGSGHFGAGRGERRHKGVDYVLRPGSAVVSPVSGIVDRITDVYKDKSKNRHLKAIVIKNPKNRTFEAKVLYIKPGLGIYKGASIIGGKTILGISQSLQMHYMGISDHVHIQIEADKRMLVPISKQGMNIELH